MKKLFLMIIGVAAFIALVGYFTGPGGTGSLKDITKSFQKKIVKIDEVETQVNIADSDSERSQGLSGRASLPEGEGLLFIFPDKTSNPFWMKDMNFAIDIIWISDDKVIGIEKDAKPQPGADGSQLKLYFPPSSVSYVLEVPSGFSDRKGINTGDNVDLSGI